MRYSRHAIEQMAERAISAHEVEEAVANPETTYTQSKPDDDRLIILGTTAMGRRLKVVLRAADPDFVITTADRDEDQ
jgi:uncharacterized DUF497 family protein